MSGDIDWRFFDISADRDGELEISHKEGTCHWGVFLKLASYEIAELMTLAEEHLKTCPVWTGKSTEPLL